MEKQYLHRIVARRKALRMSQGALARELQLLGLDISRGAIGRLEIGERRLDPDELPYFAAALRTDPNELVGWENFKHR